MFYLEEVIASAINVFFMCGLGTFDNAGTDYGMRARNGIEQCQEIFQD